MSVRYLQNRHPARQSVRALPQPGGIATEQLGHIISEDVSMIIEAPPLEWLEKDLEVTKIHDLLKRRGLEVPYRTLPRFRAEELGYRRQPPTVPVVDGEPGEELQIDFGRMGLMFDPDMGRRRPRGPYLVATAWSHQAGERQLIIRYRPCL